MQALAKALKRRGASALKTKLRFEAPKGGLLEVSVLSRPHKGARRLLASGARAFLTRGAGAVSLRPTAAGRRARRRDKRIAVQVHVRYSPLMEFPISVTRRITLPARSRRSAAAAVLGPGWRVER